MGSMCHTALIKVNSFRRAVFKPWVSVMYFDIQNKIRGVWSGIINISRLLLKKKESLWITKCLNGMEFYYEMGTLIIYSWIPL